MRFEPFDPRRRERDHRQELDDRDRPETPEIAECHRITGEDCYLLRLYLRSIEGLEEILDRFTPRGLTMTSIVPSTPVPRGGPPLANP